MLVLKFTVFGVLLIHGALCRNTQRGNTRHRLEDQEHALSVHHPPEPEIYKGIPVSVVYDDESNRADKSIKSDIATPNNLKELNETIKTDLQISKEFAVPGEISNKNKSSLETSTFNKDQQIPVAVVYEPESSYYRKTRPNNNSRLSTKHSTTTVASDASVTEKEYTPETLSFNKQKRPNSSQVGEKQVQNEPLKISILENENKELVPKPQYDKNSASGKEKSIAEKETSRPGNSEIRTFPKRDNSTRVREFVPIIQSENQVYSHTGEFQYSYEGGDGTKAFEKGELKTYKDDNTGEAVSGGFSYTAKDGNEYSLSYTADENGYRPVGAHLPTPPPIPPAILRALAYLATKTTPEPVTESLTSHYS